MSEEERLKKLKEDAFRLTEENYAKQQVLAKADLDEARGWTNIRSKVHQALDLAKAKLEVAGFTDVSVLKDESKLLMGFIGSIKADYPGQYRIRVEVQGERSIQFDPNSRSLRYVKNGRVGPQMTTAIEVDHLTKLFP